MIHIDKYSQRVYRPIWGQNGTTIFSATSQQ